MSGFKFRRAMMSLAMLSVVFVTAFAGTVVAQRRGRQPRGYAVVCGDPTARCDTRWSGEFQPYDLPFRLPPRAVIFETELFYAIVLKSVRTASDYDDCENVFISEAERLSAQRLFPTRKVFASRCYEAGNVFYTNIAPRTQFMGVFAGRTQAEAARTLDAVRATGQFPGATIRRMRAGINGT